MPGDTAKTYVLVHGGYHGGWCWKEVAAQLRAMGHQVYTPTLTGLGERSHLAATRPTLATWIEDIAQVIRFEELDSVILVGHSFAGSILSSLADRMPQRLRHLVYLDALVLRSGESSADRSPERFAQLHQRAMESSNGLTIPPPDPSYFGITDPVMAAWVNTLVTPHPLQTYNDRIQLHHPLGNGLPGTYIACAKPMFATNALSREIARSVPSWRYREIDTGHDAMLLWPTGLTAVLADIG